MKTLLCIPTLNAGKQAHLLLSALNTQTCKPDHILIIDSSSDDESVSRAIELLGEVDFDIVIVGGTNPRVFGHSEIPMPDSVKYLGYVTDAELKALYKKAGCFVYPSFYEGFGLPPIEAMSCSCPVIVSNAASLPEVCRDAAMYCDPHSPEEIADKVRQVMNDAYLREALRHRGLERTKRLTWERCALETFR